MTKNKAKPIDFDQLLQRSGLKKTRQRKIITEIFFTQPNAHHHIDDLLALAKKADPKINYSTIYRTLMAFVEAGLANHRQFEGGRSQFEISSHEHHDHLICIACHQIIEFTDPVIEGRQDEIAKKHNFELTHHKMELYGRCAKCK